MMTECGVCGKRIVIPDPRFYVYKRGDVFFCDQNCMIVYKTKLTREASGFNTKRKEEEDMNHKLTKEIKKRAVEIAMEGGDFLGYLKKNGAKNPSAAWWYIKATLEKADPEKYMELLAVLATNKPTVEIAEKLPQEAVAEVPEDLKEFDEAARQMQKKPEPVEAKGKEPLPAGTTKKEVFDALKVPGAVVIGQDMAEGEGQTAYTVTYVDEIQEEKRLDFEIMAIKTDLGDFQKDRRDGLVYWTTEEGEKICLTRMEWTKLADTIPKMLNILGGV